MAQWIRHRPTEPGIAGSSPAGVIIAPSAAAPVLWQKSMSARAQQRSLATTVSRVSVARAQHEQALSGALDMGNGPTRA